MPERFLTYFFSLCLILKLNLAKSQSDISYDISGHLGRSHSFYFGSDSIPKPEKLTLRTDNTFKQIMENFLNYRGLYIDLHFIDYCFNRYSESLMHYLIDTTSQRRSNKDVKFDLDFLSSNRVGGFVISFGNSNISPKSKIDALLFDPLNGRPENLNEFSNTKVLILQKNLSSADYPYLSDPFTGGSGNEYSCDPYLLSEISKMKSLEKFIFMNRGSGAYDHYLKDCPGKEFFELPKLRSICLDGIPYLPIPGAEWKKMNFFRTGYIFYPELINLALVLFHYGKDTSNGNWKQFLLYGNYKDSLTIPFNGKYQSHYQNGNLLCEGNYLNGKEDGEWKFWYEDGKLCQNRMYDKGKRVGQWYFMVPQEYDHPALDTILQLTYKNDTLIYRQDKIIDDHTEMDSQGCQHRDCNYHGATILRIKEYKFDYNQSNEILIDQETRLYNLDSKVPFSLIPLNSKEVWIYNDSAWVYMKEDEHCYDSSEGKVSTFYTVAGKKGEPGYYSSVIWLSKSSSNQIYKKILVLDFENCIYEENEFVAENDTSEFKLVSKENKMTEYVKKYCKNP